MATKIVTKNSSTASAVPTTGDLVQGELAVNVADKRLFTEDNAGAIVELGTNPSTLTVTGEITANGGIALGDNDKATFGAGDDLQIYHSGAHSFISDVGTGNLYLSAADSFIVRTEGVAVSATFTPAASVDLNYAGSTKLATTSTGIDVTGTATMDGLSVDGTAEVSLTDSDYFKINHQTRGGDYRVTTSGISAETLTLRNGASQILTAFASNGDISFYEDTGTTAKFFWDASAESLGIGTSSPSAALHVSASPEVVTRLSRSAGSNSLVLFQDPTTTTAPYIGSYGNEMAFGRYGGGESMRIDSSGNLLVGKTSANNGVVGIQAMASGDINATVSNDTVARFNRLSGDGEILRFQKDTATVGSIGGGVTFLTIGSGTGNVYFQNGVMAPTASSSGASSNGVIDLGTSSSRFKDLYLSGNISAGTGGANANNYQIKVSAGTTGLSRFIAADTSDAGYIDYEHSSDSWIHRTAGAERMRIDANGKIFMNEGVPFAWTDGSLNVSADIYGDSSDNLVFRNTSAKTERMRIDSSGNVGIGVTNPSDYYANDLVVGAAAEGGITIASTATSNTNYLNFADSNSGTARYAGMIAYDHSSDSMAFRTTSVERMRIDSSGNLLIGKTTTGVAGAGTVIRAGGELFVTRAGDVMNLNRLTSDGEILVFRKDGVSVGSISTNANSLPSDRNFKKNITDLTLGLDFVKSLSPKTYNFKIDDEGQAVMAGLIAQEVEESLTAAGVERNSMTLLQHEPTEDVNESDYKMDYVKFVPVLINAMKEQQTLIESLTARIAALEE